MSQQSFGSTATLIDRLCRASGESTTSTRARQQVLDYLNTRYYMILSGRHWRFLHQELYFDLKAPYSAGTVVATKGSTSVVGTGTTWTSDMADQKFRISGDDTVYEIESVGSATTLTLKSPYTDETSSGVSYKILFDTYTRDEEIDSIDNAYLGGIYGGSANIRLVGMEHFRQQQKSTSQLEGQPLYLTAYVVTESGDPNWTMEVFPAPEKAYTMLIHYNVSLTALTDETFNYPLIPNKYQHVLFYAVLADMLADQKERAASDSASKKFSVAYTKMCGDYEMTDPRARIRNQRPYLERARDRSRYRHGRSGRERGLI